MNITTAIKEISKSLTTRYWYCDVGARWGVHNIWRELSSVVNSVSFEPDPEEFQELNAKILSGDLLLPEAIAGHVGRATLYLTKSRGASSLLRPNKKLIENFPDANRFDVEKQVDVQVTTFDKLSEDKKLPNLNFIKLDIQGGELLAMKGGKSVINCSCIGLECEVEYVPLYENQPLFPEVHDYVTKVLGFQLYSVKNYYWKMNNSRHIQGTNGQLIYADTLYLRPPQRFYDWIEQSQASEQKDLVLKGIITGLIFGYVDYSYSLLASEQAKSYLSTDEIARFSKLLNKISRPNFFRSYKLSRFFYYLYKKTQSFHQGWASADPSLGQAFSVKGIKSIFD